MKRRQGYLGLLVLLLLAGHAHAEWQMVGEARLQFMFWDIYDSRLYSRDGRYMEQQRPLKLEIQYLRDIKAADLVKNTGKEWDGLGVSPDLQQPWLEALSGMWPDIRQYDVLAIEINEQGESLFSWNGKAIGRIGDPVFGQHFIDIWLSPGTSQPALRLALLGEQ